MVAGGTAVDGMAVGSTLLPLSFGAPPQHMHMHMHMRMHMHMHMHMRMHMFDMSTHMSILVHACAPGAAHRHDAAAR